MRQPNRRQRALLLLLLTLAVLLAVTMAGALLTQRAMETDFSRMNRSPSLTFLFGTDWMGRDMLARTLAGLSLSIRIGVLTALVSAVIALFCGVTAALSRKADAVLSWCIDLFLGIPHILLVMLISLAFGRGFLGVVAGVSLSHWPSLARVIRGEVLSLRHAPYLLAAEKLGVSRRQIVRRHLLPHLLPQFLTGLILQFPRGQRHLPGLRTVLGAARHRGHPLGEHAVPHHRPVVAGPVPRAGPGGGGPPLCRSGGAGAAGAGPVQCASVRQEDF